MVMVNALPQNLPQLWDGLRWVEVEDLHNFHICYIKPFCEPFDLRGSICFCYASPLIYYIFHLICHRSLYAVHFIYTWILSLRYIVLTSIMASMESEPQYGAQNEIFHSNEATQSRLFVLWWKMCLRLRLDISQQHLFPNWWFYYQQKTKYSEQIQ